MSDNITQMRLAMRLDGYLREYTGKKIINNTPYGEKWNEVWQAADVARTNNILNPEMVDDVRQALNKL